MVTEMNKQTEDCEHIEKQRHTPVECIVIPTERFLYPFFCCF